MRASGTTAERARGRWRGLLVAAGMKADDLTGRNGPCPFCGGRDRWCFLDRNGSGSWICRNCGPVAHGCVGDGFELLKRVLGTTDYATVAHWVDEKLPEHDLPTRETSPIDLRKRAAWVWEHTKALADGDRATEYFRSRGIAMSRWPSNLRTRGELLFAKITSSSGEFLSVHVRNVATREHWRSMKGSYPAGSVVRLWRPHDGILGIAEGVESAISAAMIFRIPVWSALSDSGIAAFEPPADVTGLIIFADNDKAGLESAERLKARFGRNASIDAPKGAGADWNDVLQGKAK